MVCRALGFSKGPKDKPAATGTPFVKDLPGPTIKKEPEELDDSTDVTEDPKSPENPPMENKSMVPMDHEEDPDQMENRMDDPQSPETPAMEKPSQAPENAVVNLD